LVSKDYQERKSKEARQMNKLLVLVGCGLLSSIALADIPVNQWLDRLDDRGAEIEVIRVASEKPLVATKETDAEVESILREAEALENETSENQKHEDSS
jgi:hypothetical protein